MELHELQEKALREKDLEIEGWKRTAAQALSGLELYQGLIREIGVTFGEEAYIALDGSKQDQVLALKVPELVAELRRQLVDARAALAAEGWKSWEADARHLRKQLDEMKRPTGEKDLDKALAMADRMVEEKPDIIQPGIHYDDLPNLARAFRQERARAEALEKAAEKRLKDLEEQIKIQCSDGNWNYNEYMQGLANGLILGRHTIRGDHGDPPFMKAPEKWLADRPVENCGHVGEDGCCAHPNTMTPECHGGVACPALRDKAKEGA